MNPILHWLASPSPGVTGYSVTWSRNGVAAGTLTVPQSSSGDSSGYSTDWNSANPTTPLVGGEVLTASVEAVNATTGLDSVPVLSNSLTVPLPPPTPPAPPTNVVLSLT